STGAPSPEDASPAGRGSEFYLSVAFVLNAAPVFCVVLHFLLRRAADCYQRGLSARRKRIGTLPLAPCGFEPLPLQPGAAAAAAAALEASGSQPCPLSRSSSSFTLDRPLDCSASCHQAVRLRQRPPESKS
ncbi:hypothetical protein DIPPA_20123, partial [Diplonema papillatum]